MAVKFWRGGSSTTAQRDTLTVGGTIEIGDLFLVTMSNADGTASVTLTVASTTTSTATTASEIVTAFNASTDPLFTPVTATLAGSTVLLDADAVGTPFTCTVTTTEAGGGAADTQTFVRAATTANRSPNDFTTAANWSDSVVPVAGDTLIFDGRAANSLIYGLNQSALAALAAVRHYRSMAYDLGTTTAYLRLSVTDLKLNLAPEDGSSPTGAAAYWDTGTNASTVEVHGSKDTGESGIEPVVWKGVHASNAVRLLGGIVGIATLKPGDVATCPLINVYGDSTRLHCSSGCTLTTVNQYGGRILLNGAATTVSQFGGSAETRGSGAYTTLNIHGNFALNSTGLVTTANVESAGFIDVTFGPQVRAVSDCNLKGTSSRVLTKGVEIGQVNLTDGASANQISTVGDTIIQFA